MAELKGWNFSFEFYIFMMILSLILLKKLYKTLDYKYVLELDYILEF